VARARFDYCLRIIFCHNTDIDSYAVDAGSSSAAKINDQPSTDSTSTDRTRIKSLRYFLYSSKEPEQIAAAS
jgi:hypothetical protein